MSRYYRGLDGVVHGTSQARRAAQRADRRTRAAAQGVLLADGAPIPTKIDLDRWEAATVKSVENAEKITEKAESKKRLGHASRVREAAAAVVVEPGHGPQRVVVNQTHAVAFRVAADGTYLDGERREKRVRNGVETTDGRPRRKCACGCGAVTRKRATHARDVYGPNRDRHVVVDVGAPYAHE